MKYFHYVSQQQGLIRILDDKRPTFTAIAKHKTWTIDKFKRGEWQSPVRPKITALVLLGMTFLGSVEQRDGGV